MIIIIIWENIVIMKKMITSTKNVKDWVVILVYGSFIYRYTYACACVYLHPLPRYDDPWFGNLFMSLAVFGPVLESKILYKSKRRKNKYRFCLFKKQERKWLFCVYKGKMYKVNNELHRFWFIHPNWNSKTTKNDGTYVRHKWSVHAYGQYTDLTFGLAP